MSEDWDVSRMLGIRISTDGGGGRAVEDRMLLVREHWNMADDAKRCAYRRFVMDRIVDRINAVIRTAEGKAVEPGPDDAKAG